MLKDENSWHEFCTYKGMNLNEHHKLSVKLKQASSRNDLKEFTGIDWN